MHLHIFDRKSAKEAGLKKFYTAEPCKHGHQSERYTSSGKCVACEKLICQKFRNANKEKIAKANKEWRLANKDHVKKSRVRYREENPEKVAESKKRYYEENKEKCLMQSRAHKESNRDHYKVLQKKWREENRERVRTANRNRKKKIKATEGTHTADDIKNLLQMQGCKCAACFIRIKKNNYHVDHIQPLALGGSNWPSNLQILCPTCNMSKGAKKPEDFYAGLGFLL
jgi:5-methylcytosine-specific restriction endonuclease McrA